MRSQLSTATTCDNTSVMIAGGSGRVRNVIRNWAEKAGISIGESSPSILFLIQDEADRLGEIVASLGPLRRQYPITPVVVVARNASEDLAVASFRAGATDYLRWPVAEAELYALLKRLLPSTGIVPTSPALLGNSAAMSAVRVTLRSLATTHCSVLLTGETGTGKEVAAKLLHEWSDRSAGPFVSINCAAIPEGLVEGELFGYERGAFTGAASASTGKLAAGNGGTVLLDEIGELSFSVQAKLLRAIEQREVQRLGSLRTHAVDVRWVAATNRDLGQMARDGHFRADLYYRINVAEVVLPALRDRTEDIRDIAAHFLELLAREYRWPDAHFSPDAWERMGMHDWPGNVRELRNVVECSLIRAGGSEIKPIHLPVALSTGLRKPPAREMDERARLVEALQASRGNKREAARRLHWSRMTLYRKLARYGLDVSTDDTPVTQRASHA